IAPYILPALDDRPLSFKRFPHGLRRPETFHQRIKWRVPPGVRVESVKAADRVFEPRLIGGSLATLLYGVQIDFISMDPWLSRVHSPDHPDYAVIDLDPGAGVPFVRVADVAKWLHELFELAGIVTVVKTSGIGGLHLIVPLAKGTDYRQARALAMTFATRVARRHPEHATVERAIAARGRRVYLDCDQNLRAKTIAAPYSARHSVFAGISAPLRWSELDRPVKPDQFTVQTIQERLRHVGDLWLAVRQSVGVNIPELYERWLR